MKQKIIFLFIFFFGIVFLITYGYFKATSPSFKKDSSPLIEISPSFYDFGEIKYGEKVKYSFKVKNKGNGILKIKRVATSCGCTEAKIKKENLFPQEETELIVSYDSGAMSGFHALGKQERIIYLQTNDPKHPQVEVKIFALVKE